MSESILLVEDEALVADMVRLNLEHEGFRVTAVGDAESARELLRHERFDLVVMDLMLPRMDGLSLTRLLRQEGDTTPVLMLTARGELDAKVSGFEAGADDYLTKPFAMPELLVRVRALIRRHTAARGVPAARLLKLGEFEVNLDTRDARTKEGPTVLTETEVQLLAYLVKHEGQVMGRAEILEDVWGMDRFPTARTVDNYILRLRKLFEVDPENPSHILTVRGRGYRLVR